MSFGRRSSLRRVIALTIVVVVLHELQFMCRVFVSLGHRSTMPARIEVSAAGGGIGFGTFIVKVGAVTEGAIAAFEPGKDAGVIAGSELTPDIIFLRLFYCVLGIAVFINNFVDGSPVAGLFGQKFSGVAAAIVGSEDIMSEKAHGTTSAPVQKVLRWNCDSDIADRICCFNRHLAERSGYYNSVEDFRAAVDAAKNDCKEMTFYDSVTGKALFVAPRGRTWDEFLNESRVHGWPSFRDEEVIEDFVRVLPNGETVSTEGTHLGHNLPDSNGNRYCINLVSVAGNPCS